MNDPNPYDSPPERSSRGGQFWIGCAVGAAVGFFLMLTLLLVAAVFLAYFRVSSSRPVPVPAAVPEEIEGPGDVPAAPEKIEASEPDY